MVDPKHVPLTRRQLVAGGCAVVTTALLPPRLANATGGGSTPQYLLNVGDGVNPQAIFGRFENGLTVQGEDALHDVTVVWWPL